jgi:hypothetical protein
MVYIKWEPKPTKHGWYMVCSFKRPSKKELRRAAPKFPAGHPALLDRVWLVFDLSNGENCLPGTSRNYVWVHRTREEARKRCAKHRRNQRKYATLSRPILFEMD